MYDTLASQVILMEEELVRTLERQTFAEAYFTQIACTQDGDSLLDMLETRGR